MKKANSHLGILKSLGAMLLALTLMLPAARASISVDDINFTTATMASGVTEGGTLSGGGTMCVAIRNTGSTTETLSAVTINGTAIASASNLKWWRQQPTGDVPPGGVVSILAHFFGSPVAEGLSVTIGANCASGQSASLTKTLTTPKLRIGSVMPSADYKTLYLFLRNRDTVAWTVNNVYVDTEVTSQCAFLGGTTISGSRIGIVKVTYTTALTNLTPMSVRVRATPSGGSATTVGASIRLLDPKYNFGTWNGAAWDTAEKCTEVRYRYHHTVQTGDNNLPDEGIDRTTNYFYRAVANQDACANTDQFLQDNGRLDSVYAWYLHDEAERSYTSTHCNDDFIKYTRNSARPVLINLAASKVFNEFGWTVDMPCMDHYGHYAPLVNSAPSTHLLQEVMWYSDALKQNTEPLRTWYWFQGCAPGTWSTQPANWSIESQFWTHVMCGAKSTHWFKAAAGDAASYSSQFNRIESCARRLEQVKNIVLYGDTIDCTSSSNTKAPTRGIVGEEAMLAIIVSHNDSKVLSSYSLTSLSGLTLTVNVPSWISIQQVKQIGAADSINVTTPTYSVNGQTVTITGISLNNSTAGAGLAFLIGKNDTTPPEPPLYLTRSRMINSTSVELSWDGARDNYGVRGYKLYRNGVEFADTSGLVYTNTSYDASSVYTVKAYDMAGNLSAASPAWPASLPGQWKFDNANTGDYNSPAIRTDTWVDGAQVANVGVSGGQLHLDTTSQDAYIVTGGWQQPVMSIDSSAKKFIAITMQHNTPGTKAQLYWTTSASGSYSGNKSVQFSVVPNDTVLRTYVVDMTDVPGWTGSIQNLQFVPAVAAGHVDIDSILITDVVDGGWLWNANGDSLGWNTDGNTANWTAANGIWSFDINGNDPYVHPGGWNGSGYSMSVDTAARKFIRFRMQNPTSSTMGELFWGTTVNGNSWGSGGAYLQWSEVPSDPGFTTYVVDMSASPAWTGTLQSIRLDPTTTGTGRCQLDSFSICSNPKASGVQTITFNNPGGQIYGVAPITLSATADSGLPVSYTVTAGPATISGNTLTIAGAGSVTVQADQAGDAYTYGPAASVSQTFTVNPRTPYIGGWRYYDGTTVVGYTNLTCYNLVGSDEVTVASGTAPLASANQGTGVEITSLSGLILGGADSSKYTLDGAGGSISILPLPVQLSGSRPYNGGTDAGYAILSVANKVSGDSVNVASGSGTLASANRGVQPIISFGSLALGNNAAANYTLTGATGSVLVDSLPVSPNINVTTEHDQPIVLDVAKLVAKATDADPGDTLSVTVAGPTSTNGPANNVALNTDAGTITYTPASGYAGPDRFSYTISDLYGGTCTPNVYVTVTSIGRASPNVVSCSYDSASATFTVKFAGVPGVTYGVERSSSSGPWTQFTTARASDTGPEIGLFTVTDTAGGAMALYRTVYPAH